MSAAPLSSPPITSATSACGSSTTPTGSYLSGKRVVLVDDFDRARHDLDQDRRDGARGGRDGSAHAHRVSPPTTNSCFYGVDTPERSALLAATHSVEEMARIIGVDSLAFVSIDGLYRAMGEERRSGNAPQFCDACFTGEYPIALVDQEEGDTARQLSLFRQLA